MKHSIKELREICQERPENVSKSITKSIYRFFTIYITWLLIKLKLSANTVTVLSIFVSLIGGILLMLGTRVGFFLGALFFIFFVVMDYCDGEVARYWDDQTMTGLYIELLAHYFGIFFFFTGLSYGIYQQNKHEVIFLIGIMGITGAILRRIKSLITWQVICVENLRSTKRIANRNEAKTYEAKLDGCKEDEVGERVRRSAVIEKVNVVRRIIIDYATTDYYYTNLFFAIAIINCFIEPFLIDDFSVGFVEVFFIYSCFINLLTSIYLIFRHIANRVTETAYRDFFIRKNASLDFWF